MLSQHLMNIELVITVPEEFHIQRSRDLEDILNLIQMCCEVWKLSKAKFA